MALLKDLKVNIGINTKSLTKLNGDLRRTKNTFRRNFGQIQAMAQNMGRNLSVGVTAPLGIMAVQSVKAFDTQAKAIAQVEAGLKSTGAQVGFTSQELQKMASDLQTKTLFGDEVILKDATSQLLTFTNIAGDQFGRTQKAALDLATRLDGDLKSASIQLGKALNDPIANLSALSRSGIQFSAEQKETIKALAETNQLAEAQTIILDELEKQYGGSAEAAAEAGTGPFKQLANTIGDLSEEFGKLINDMIRPLIPRVQAIVGAFSNLSDGSKKLILVIGMGAAALGPALLATSALMTSFTSIAGAMGISMTAALGPIGLLAAAIGVTLAGAFAILEGAERRSRKRLEGLDKTVQELYGNIEEGSEEAARSVAVIDGVFDRLDTDDVIDLTNANGELKKRLSALRSESLKTAQQMYRQGKITDINAEATAQFRLGLGTLRSEYHSLVHVVKEDTEVKQQNTVATKQQTTETENLVEMERSRINVLGNLKQLQTDTAVNTLAAVAANKTLKGSYTDLGASLEPVMGRFKQLGMFAKDQLPAFFEGAFQALSEGTKSFGDFMLQTLQRLLVKAAALVATFAVLSIMMGGATGVAELTGGKAGLKFFMAGGMGIPQMADGGLFTGASLAMVGEGPGTSAINPEVVAPLDKLQQMMGGGNVTVTGRLDGRDILLSSERSNLDRNRVRGF
jgi:hypothetical protein